MASQVPPYNTLMLTTPPCPVNAVNDQRPRLAIFKCRCGLSWGLDSSGWANAAWPSPDRKTCRQSVWLFCSTSLEQGFSPAFKVTEI